MKLKIGNINNMSRKEVNNILKDMETQNWDITTYENYHNLMMRLKKRNR